ncbi:gamma-glutamylcyclotransferase family protein [Labilithrix luteola]|uniref:gamma-glutamylcyclotransferase family protein n=1 Tax=Labilithrix luteola TaxID=1391654 RepID=UPI0011BA620A|nr:gamma-glutamylcyclotransferase family protein [Labilithrix luteola]
MQEARIFVYGTLMRDAANHRVLVDLGARFVATARTLAPRTLVDLGPYPALLRDAQGPSAVHGEVWTLAEPALAPLDAFEGCPTLYVRELVELSIDGSTDEESFVESVWTYVFARPAPTSAKVIFEGKYRAKGHVLKIDATEVSELLDIGGENQEIAAPAGGKVRRPR